jgi:hypothetical protein
MIRIGDGKNKRGNPTDYSKKEAPKRPRGASPKSIAPIDVSIFVNHDHLLHLPIWMHRESPMGWGYIGPERILGSSAVFLVKLGQALAEVFQVVKLDHGIRLCNT